MPKFPPPREPNQSKEEYKKEIARWRSGMLLMYSLGLLFIIILAILYTYR